MELDSKIMEKAATLIEALPYIQRFNRKIIVVKYGGSAMADEELKRNVIKDVVLLKLVGFKPIIVHGGGKEISRWVSKVGMEPRFVNGLRVTDADTMEIAEMVLNKVNKSLVSMVNELGVKAVGISGKDGQLLRCDKKLSNGQDIGFVGDIKEVNPKILFDLLEIADNAVDRGNIGKRIVVFADDAFKIHHLPPVDDADQHGAVGVGVHSLRTDDRTAVTQGGNQLVRQLLRLGGDDLKLRRRTVALENGIAGAAVDKNVDRTQDHRLVLQVVHEEG